MENSEPSRVEREQPGVTAEQPQEELRASPPWLAAVRAAETKKATDICVLDLRGVAFFADYFFICTGSNPRQIQAIADEIALRLKHQGELPLSLEGYQNAEWILVDYGDYLVHILSEKARAYYDLERLWRHAKQVKIPLVMPGPAKQPHRPIT